MTDIRIGDIVVAWECPYCDASGQIPNPEYHEWFYGEQRGESPGSDLMDCGMCKGAGHILTPDGSRLLAFLDIFRGEG